MLRSLCLSLFGLSLLASPAFAQTPAKQKPTYSRSAAPRPATSKKPQTRMVPNTSPAARRADPLRGTNDNGAGQSGYAAPGEPMQMPGSGGKNTANYDGQPARPAKNSTMNAPK